MLSIDRNCSYFIDRDLNNLTTHTCGWKINCNITASFSAIQEAAGVEDTRLGGATVFPTDTNASINSLHHPWACSIRRRGFRGRHRCGITLLSGK